MDIEIVSQNDSDIIKYRPEGVCAKYINLVIKNDEVYDAEILGGCDGNHNGIVSLIKGMSVKSVVDKLRGIKCGSRDTSCPDQLAKAIEAYINQKQVVKA